MDLTFTVPLDSGTHGRGTYHSVSLPDDAADLLADLPVPRAGFGSIRVDATVGRTTWRTSVFPDKGGFLLLISRKVMKAENLAVGEPVTVRLAVVV